MGLTARDQARFWAKVDRSGGPDACWPWRAGRRKGYGRFWLSGTDVTAHRVAWTLLKGPIPEGLDVLHTCDWPPCCNMARHGVMGTHADNNADRDAKGRQARGARNGAYTHPERVARGERHGRARLTAAQVADIRTRYAATGVSQRALAREHGVARTTIANIVRRQTWTHVVIGHLLHRRVGAPDEGEG